MSRDLEDLLFAPFCFDKEFYSAFKEEKTCSYIRKEDKMIIVHNVLGISKEDLKLSLKNEKGEKYLVISGKTKDTITMKEYSVNSRVHINEKNLNMNEMNAVCRNGLLYVSIPYSIGEDSVSLIDIQ